MPETVNLQLIYSIAGICDSFHQLTAITDIKCRPASQDSKLYQVMDAAMN